jgi:hypothetical protein
MPNHNQHRDLNRLSTRQGAAKNSVGRRLSLYSLNSDINAIISRRLARIDTSKVFDYPESVSFMA